MIKNGGYQIVNLQGKALSSTAITIAGHLMIIC